MSNTKKKFGVVAPRRFILRVKKENGKREGGIEATEQSISQTSGRNTTFERSWIYSFFIHFFFAVVFDNMQQQDAHEFLNYLLNTIADLLQAGGVL